MYIYTFHLKSEHKTQQHYLNLKKPAIQNSSRYLLHKVVLYYKFHRIILSETLGILFPDKTPSNKWFSLILNSYSHNEIYSTSWDIKRKLFYSNFQGMEERSA
jgi:hypothetical protein